MKWTPAEIRKRRHLKGKDWNQERLADELGVSRRAVSAWETGAARPQGANLDALEAVLGDVPVPEPTLRGATNAELTAEIARRLGEHRIPGDNGESRLPGQDLAWPDKSGGEASASRP